MTWGSHRQDSSSRPNRPAGCRCTCAPGCRSPGSSWCIPGTAAPPDTAALSGGGGEETSWHHKKNKFQKIFYLWDFCRRWNSVHVLHQEIDSNKDNSCKGSLGWTTLSDRIPHWGMSRLQSSSGWSAWAQARAYSLSTWHTTSPLGPDLKANQKQEKGCSFAQICPQPLNESPGSVRSKLNWGHYQDRPSSANLAAV